MKTLILLLVSTTILWGGTPQTENDSVSLSVKPNVFELSELPETVEVTLTNNTYSTISAGLRYWIEKYETCMNCRAQKDMNNSGKLPCHKEINCSNENSGWKKVSPEHFFDDIGYNLAPSVFYTYDKDLFTEEIEYKIGKYRIVKYYLKSDGQKTQDFNVYAEFEIK